MPSWSVHLDICKRLLGWNYCTDDLVKVDELIDTHYVHDVGRKKDRRDSLRFAALLVKHYFRGAKTHDGILLQQLEDLKRYLESALGDVSNYLRNLSEEFMTAPLQQSSQYPLMELEKANPALSRAVKLFSVVAHLYLEEVAEYGTLEEKLVLAWYLHQGTRLLVEKKALEYALLHHVVDLAAEYVARERPSRDAPYRIASRVRENETLKEVAGGLDLLVSAYDPVEDRSYSPLKLLENLLKLLERNAREVYALLAYSMVKSGVPPGFKALGDEICELLKWFRFTHGYGGFVRVNNKPFTLLGASQRIASLLKEKQEVRIEFYDHGVKREDVYAGLVEPVLTLVVRDYNELKSKLCNSILGSNRARMINLLPEDAAKIKAICS
ncbi:MAG: hypothetical protein QXO48_02230 [Desulfurococcaceae archaeon]